MLFVTDITAFVGQQWQQRWPLLQYSTLAWQSGRARALAFSQLLLRPTSTEIMSDDIHVVEWGWCVLGSVSGLEICGTISDGWEIVLLLLAVSIAEICCIDALLVCPVL